MNSCRSRWLCITGCLVFFAVWVASATDHVSNADWPKLRTDLRDAAAAYYSPPQKGEMLIVELRAGHSVTGVLDTASRSSVTIGGKEYQKDALSRPCQERLFSTDKHDYATKASFRLFQKARLYFYRDAFDDEQVRNGVFESPNWISPSTGMEFVRIPSMGIWVGKFEVTNTEYRRKNPEHDSTGIYRGPSLDEDRQPVVRVNFHEAVAYAEWLTKKDQDVLGGMRYRLASEKEWTALAQCGDERAFPWGNNWPPVIGQAGNYAGQESLVRSKIKGYNDGFPVAAPVDRLWANPWGLHGVGGNVWEACASDSSGESFGGWRGASWHTSVQRNLRISFRFPVSESFQGINAGFRLVLSR